jgi:MoaA/NifB/PqqE/SkfB family radical SAM enzyme
MTLSLNTLTHLDINLGDKCNQKCIMCECCLNPNPPDLPPSKLWSKMFEAISYAESECNKLDKIMISGGEPFEHLGPVDFLKEQSFGAYLTIYTNFTVPLPKSHWPSNIHFIASMDAPNDLTYRQIRRMEDFRISQNNIKENKRQIIHVDTTVSRQNISKLDQILEKTEEIGCTHWFLPVDPRVLRYVRRNPYDLRADAMARRVTQALLNELDLARVKSFFEINRENKRINDYNMFAGLFYTGLHHFADITGGMSDDQHLIPSGNIDRCAAGERTSKDSRI